MPVSTLRDICIDCADQQRVARFWADVLGYEMRSRPDPEGNEFCAFAPRENV